MADEAQLFEWHDGKPSYRGIPVEEESVSVAAHSFRIAALKDAADLLDHQDFAQRFLEEDRAPYGLELWPAAPMLADYVLRGEDGAGRRAIEIGCGLGLVSMAATLKGWRMLATDNEPESLRFAAYNADLNGVEIDRYDLFDWTAPSRAARYERVFGADILYDRANHAPILSALDGILETGAEAWLADPNRSVADRFEALAREHGFSVTVDATSYPFRDRGVIDGRIFKLQRQPR